LSVIREQSTDAGWTLCNITLLRAPRKLVAELR
jgi:hypothetical protein